MVAITFWQWILEFLINMIVIILMARLGGNRQFDHISSLTATWFKVCLVPSMYLMAHASFYRHAFILHCKCFDCFLFCFVTGVTSQKCRRAPHSKLCQSPSHFRPRAGSSARNPVSGILQSLLYAYYPGIFPSGVSSRFTINL